MNFVHTAPKIAKRHCGACEVDWEIAEGKQCWNCATDGKAGPIERLPLPKRHP